MTDVSFESLYRRHNGPNYLAPLDLEVSSVRPRRVLVVGSCLAEVWGSQIDCPYDFIMTNNLNKLPEEPPRPVSEYDLQLIQIPLRPFVMPDDLFWHHSFDDVEAYKQAFNETLGRLRYYLEFAAAWNKKYKLLTFLANFLVPQQNVLGRFAPRYDLRNPVYFIERLNFHLSEEVRAYENAYVLDIDAVSSVLGKKYIQDDTTDLQSHAALLGNTHHNKDLERIQPVVRMTEHYELHRDEFIAAVWHQAAAMYKTIRGVDTVKLVIVDLDNTLWRGVVADESEISDKTLEGWPLGLIEALSYLKKRGVILAVASQNEEKCTRELWDRILRGRFRLDEFAVVKIDWRPKVEKIEEILQLTNILPRNVLFIDDNPVERAAVKAAFPDIRVLGQYPYYLKRILLWSPELQTSAFSTESARRTELIQAQVERESVRKQMSRDEFLASLNVQIDFNNLASTHHPSFARAFELLNKTNQFNTMGKRWTREECEANFKAEWDFVAFTVKDRFADYGLVACAWISSGNTIEQFVMSCRVIGLDVENKIIDWLGSLMLKNGETKIRARLIETDSNFPCRDMYWRHGFVQDREVWTKSLVREDLLKSAVGVA
jgi:FkbH-like protein